MTKNIQKMKKIIENINDDRLRKELLKTNRKQLSYIGDMSVVEIVEKFLKLEKDCERNTDLIKEIGIESTEIIELYENIKDKVNNLEIILELEDSDEKYKIDYYKNLRKEIFELITGITAYLTEISYTNEITKEMLAKQNTINNCSDKNIDLDKFYRDVYGFIVKEEITAFEKISRLTSTIPMRISKQKFYDIVKESIIRELKNANKTKVDIKLNRYKSIFNGTLEVGYGSRFNLFFTRAQELKTFNLKEVSIDTVKEINEKTKSHLIDIYNIINIFTQCGMIINRFIVISSINDYFKKQEVNQNIISIINKLKDFNVNSNEKNREQILKICENNKVKLTKKMNDSNTYFGIVSNEYYKRSIKIDKELEEELVKTQNSLAYLNDIYLENEEMLVLKEDMVDEVYLGQAVDNLIQYLDRNIKNMDSIQRKVRMRRVLATINNPFIKIEDFLIYLKSSIGINTPRWEIELVSKRVNKIMDEYEKRH